MMDNRNAWTLSKISIVERKYIDIKVYITVDIEKLAIVC